ncbi:hypothetical protein [Rhizobium sp. CSW-27]|uniref:hypothetical protein n=1 Tax=Rhizobium sp. CSW-27 TaxID=2839985 RepID=UPI002078B875|nr:hypothetical protein [Rhizobium sp. CSW-27]
MTGEVYVALFYVEHPLLESPIRLSTDWTERLSDDPEIYGTRSTWMTEDPEADPFYFVVASTDLPSDIDDTPASGNIVLDNIDPEIARLLRSFTDRATIHMAVVLAETPDMVEAEYRDMSILSADITSGEVVISFSREDVELEYYPCDRMTKDRFPGLHR